MAGLNEIHAAICARFSEAREVERTPAGRRKYGRHKYDCLRNMEQGESIRLCIEAWEYSGYRCMASRLGKDYGVRFALHYRNKILTITRTDKDMKVFTKVRGTQKEYECDETDFREGFDFAVRNNPQFWDIVRDIAGRYQYELLKTEAKRRKQAREKRQS